MNIKIKPSNLKGKVSAPPSKSMAHRLLMCAGLSDGKSLIKNVDSSEDILATIDCLKALGAKIECADDEVEKDILLNPGKDYIVEGRKPSCEDGLILNARESGSTLRFFIPIAMTLGKEITFKGSERLLERPLSVHEEIAKDQNMIFEKSTNELKVKGNLKAGNYKVNGDISSQFITGLIFALSLLEEDSEIEIIPPLESRPYIDMTLKALKEFDVEASFVSDFKIAVKGSQKYKSREITVEGDYSNAAFLEAFNLVGDKIQVEGLDPESLQGDKYYKEYFRLIAEEEQSVDISDCPDLGPILIAMAAAKKGCCFTGTRRLALKESNRGKAMKEELSKMGADMMIFGDDIIVNKAFLHEADEMLDGHNDHRIVMALTVLASKLGGTIKGAEAVRKSWPSFFEVAGKLGLDWEEV